MVHPKYEMQTLPPEFAISKDLIASYVDHLDSVSVRVLGGLACALGLDPATFTSCHSGVENRCRLLHYPPVPESFDKYAGLQWLSLLPLLNSHIAQH